MILEYKKPNKHLIDPDDTQLTPNLMLATTQVMETSDQSLYDKPAWAQPCLHLWHFPCIETIYNL